MAVCNLGFAPAKINLTLHVTGQRDDGYHLLDSLVVFADVGDQISVRHARAVSLALTGPMSDGVPVDASNLVLQAAHMLNGGGAEIILDKHLPAAAGIGGGSSDAAATLRILSNLWGCDIPDNVVALGADVPVCLTPSVQRMSGVGDVLSPGPDMPLVPAVLVNPGVRVPTPAIFRGLQRKVNPAMPEIPKMFETVSELVDYLKVCRNDLAAPAIELAPVIQVVLARLQQLGSVFVQMSGSGATCFGLFETQAAAHHAAQALSQETDWWVAETRLGDQAKRATT